MFVYNCRRVGRDFVVVERAARRHVRDSRSNSEVAVRFFAPMKTDGAARVVSHVNKGIVSA